MITRGLARFTRNRNKGLLRTGLLVWTFVCENARRVDRILSKQSRSLTVRVLFVWSAVVLVQKDERQRKKGELERRTEDGGGIRLRRSAASSAGSSPKSSLFSPMTHENDTQRHAIWFSSWSTSHTPTHTPPFSPARPTIVRRLDLRYKLIPISDGLLQHLHSRLMLLFPPFVARVSR